MTMTRLIDLVISTARHCAIPALCQFGSVSIGTVSVQPGTVSALQHRRQRQAVRDITR